MKKRVVLTTAALVLFCAACAPKSTPDVNGIVAATVMALPTNAPLPTYTPYPSPTPFDLNGFFCEYQFCVGHPANISFFDLSAQKNPLAPSRYDLGILAGVGADVYVQLTWQRAPGTTDPQFMFDLILIGGADTRASNPALKLVRGMNVAYVEISSTALASLAAGGAGAWTCGDRVFAWKAYTQRSEAAASLFEEALAKFICG